MASPPGTVDASALQRASHEPLGLGALVVGAAALLGIAMAMSCSKCRHGGRR